MLARATTRSSSSTTARSLEYSTGTGWEYDDVWMHFQRQHPLLTHAICAEVTPDKKVVWRYGRPCGNRGTHCQPIGRDKVMFVLNGLPPASGRQHQDQQSPRRPPAPAPSLTDQHVVTASFRRVRYTAQGTYLASFLEMNQVVEYDKNSKRSRYEIKALALSVCQTATRSYRRAGHSHPRVQPKKETVWDKATDLPAFRFINHQTATRLANGTPSSSRAKMVRAPVSRSHAGKKSRLGLWDWANFGPQLRADSRRTRHSRATRPIATLIELCWSHHSPLPIEATVFCGSTLTTPKPRSSA